MSKSFGDIDMNVCNNNAYTPYKKITGLSIDSGDYTGLIEIRLDDAYEYKLEMNRLYALKKKSLYPKTVIEVLDYWHPNREPEDNYQYIYKKELIKSFQLLLYCRDAYWKISGEEMGLGKLWKPDWEDDTITKYCVGVSYNNIQSYISSTTQYILAFPTEEMRDIFYKNFKDLIEQCKELL